MWGIREGAKRPLAVSNARLRINSILNAVTRRGTFIGNSAGVLGKLCICRPDFHSSRGDNAALVYNALNSSIDQARGKHDIFGSMAAGGVSGALYKCTGESMAVVSFDMLLTTVLADL